MIKLHVRVQKEQNAIVVSQEFLRSIYEMPKNKIQETMIDSYTKYSDKKRLLQTPVKIE